MSKSDSSLATKIGNELEQAVQAIETAILNSSPSLREKSYSIENKKIVVISGVKHELDIYVEFDIGPGYKPVFIFECKNTRKAIGKNDIIVFSEKIDAIGAQKGFFVAKSFTKYAKAQAKKDVRLELLIASSRDNSQIPIPFNFHFTVLDKSKMLVAVALGMTGTEPSGTQITIDFVNTVATRNGQPFDLQAYLMEWADAIMHADSNKFPSGNSADGEYEREVKDQRTFVGQNIAANNRCISEIGIHVRYTIQVAAARVISNFEISTRGRTLSFAPVQLGNGGTIRATLVGKDL